eukprot:snap_masked-scaffold_83-processed-gene-0.17-mRNA-1 protein AED:1.00 eAED:1.00 QI:0/0/0/0/1/1/2/0/124
MQYFPEEQYIHHSRSNEKNNYHPVELWYLVSLLNKFYNYLFSNTSSSLFIKLNPQTCVILIMSLCNRAVGMFNERVLTRTSRGGFSRFLVIQIFLENSSREAFVISINTLTGRLGNIINKNKRR